MQRRHEKSEQTRELILATALQLFVERGFFATSVHDIRRAAGLSIGSIYHHFPSKEAVARALYNDLVARMTGMVESACSGHQTVRDRSRAVAELLCQATLESPALVTFVLHARHREFLSDAPPVCSTRPFELMQEMVRDGIASGELRSMDVVSASLALFGGVIRLIQLALDGVLQRPLTDYLDEVLEAGWRAVVSE
jgi:AcrR family transcriptional regulator